MVFLLPKRNGVVCAERREGGKKKVCTLPPAQGESAPNKTAEALQDSILIKWATVPFYAPRPPLCPMRIGEGRIY